MVFDICISGILINKISDEELSLFFLASDRNFKTFVN
jgi:hypothetical protein